MDFDELDCDNAQTFSISHSGEFTVQTKVYLYKTAFNKLVAGLQSLATL